MMSSVREFPHDAQRSAPREHCISKSAVLRVSHQPRWIGPLVVFECPVEMVIDSLSRVVREALARLPEVLRGGGLHSSRENFRWFQQRHVGSILLHGRRPLLRIPPAIVAILPQLTWERTPHRPRFPTMALLANFLLALDVGLAIALFSVEQGEKAGRR
jgi:hypothetical protein